MRTLKQILSLIGIKKSFESILEALCPASESLSFTKKTSARMVLRMPSVKVARKQPVPVAPSFMVLFNSKPWKVSASSALAFILFKSL